MEYFGFFREQNQSMGSDFSIHQLLGDPPTDDTPKIADYLDAGTPMLESEDLVRDVLDPALPVVGTLSILTDGEWAWPSDLPHYVRHYALRVPERFIARMRSQAWRCPAVAEDEIGRVLASLPVTQGGAG